MAYGGRQVGEYVWDSANTSAFAPSATGNFSALQYSTNPVVGEILKIAIKSSTAGSIQLAVSGTNESILYVVNPSGTDAHVYYPRVTVCGSGGAAIALGASGNMLEKPVVADVLYLAGSAIESGTLPTISYVRVYYRD